MIVLNIYIYIYTYYCRWSLIKFPCNK